MSNYTSIFKIDGEPILPPLMTLEKRYEMQMYREKAIQLERNFAEDRLKKRVQFCDTPTEVIPQEELDCIISESGTDLDENNKNSTDSCTSSPNIIVRDNKMKDFGTNTQSCENEDGTKSRILKLTKSETVCFDVNLNTLVGRLTKEQLENLRKSIEKERQNSEEKNVDAQKELPLLVPSICINPPTPISGPKNICDTLSCPESVDSFTHSGLQSSQITENPGLDISDDNVGYSNENTISSGHKHSTCSVARMLHFEKQEIEGLECEDGEDSLETNMNLRSPQRSATSPSIKSLSDTNGTCSLTTSPRAEHTFKHTLVRSSSFTLDKPSKVLLDHMGQQNREIAGQDIESNSNSSPTLSHRTIVKQRSPPPNAWRDTVESKAKRVQKREDTKLSIAPRSKSKTVFHNYASNVAPLLSKNPPPLKIKRSPYDTKVKSTQNKSNSKASHNKNQMSRNQKASAVRKSVSSTTYTINPNAPRAPLPKGNIADNETALTKNENVMNEIEKRHRQKLFELLNKQQDEQRRLQQAFEAQQIMLLEQLDYDKYRHLPMASDGSKPAVQLEGVSSMSPVQTNTGKALNFNNDHAAAPFDCESVTNSVISPSMRQVPGGFALSENVDFPFNVPKKPNSLHLGPSSVEVPPLNYLNNGKSIEKTESAIEYKQKCTNQETTNPNSEEINANAASIINAYARGFLVRRLFQTEQIQRIVQTIRDTLIFVLNLHMETMGNPKEANTTVNIKLKARLLQQLASASRTLHLIFFQTSVRERMEIISRDRKRIKAKLLSMSLKRSPRIA